MRLSRLLFLATLLFTASLLASCSDYSLTVNERVVYTPPGIFTDFRLPDLELQRCADQSIEEAKITAAIQLESLLCPEKAVHSVEGISIFSELKVLGLERNRLRELMPLAELRKLEQLNLAGNELEDISALHALTNLQYLNLEDNPKLNCTQLVAIKMTNEGKLLRPDHCQ